jgi:RNA-directed DNA polymerase
VGVDGVTWRDYEDVKSRVFINTIYEEDFLGFSYGFRQGRSQHQALDALSVGIQSRGVNSIVDAAIAAFFVEIDHDWMLKFLEPRIADQRILRLIGKWLKAGVIEDGVRVAATKGTPQGAVISPLLANIYLDYALDQWAQQWRQRHARGQVIAVRYADDSVFGFKSEPTARQFLAAMQDRLAKFGLRLNATKTRSMDLVGLRPSIAKAGAKTNLKPSTSCDSPTVAAPPDKANTKYYA